jgi:integrase
VTARDIERWRAGLAVCPRTKNKLVTVLHGIYRRAQRVWELSVNPALNVERLREPRRLDIDVFTPEEVMALVRAAGSEQDAAIFLTAAFTGLRRGELVALRCRSHFGHQRPVLIEPSGSGPVHPSNGALNAHT